jgi:hypothetical protein
MYMYIINMYVYVYAYAYVNIYAVVCPKDIYYIAALRSCLSEIFCLGVEGVTKLN